MRKGLKYTINYGVVELVKDNMTVDEIVASLLQENFVMDIFEQDIDAAREEIEFLVVETKMTYTEAFEYFKAIHRKINT
jgi:hypothetical protein